MPLPCFFWRKINSTIAFLMHVPMVKVSPKLPIFDMIFSFKNLSTDSLLYTGNNSSSCYRILRNFLNWIPSLSVKNPSLDILCFFFFFFLAFTYTFLGVLHLLTSVSFKLASLDKSELTFEVSISRGIESTSEER